ncbi:hypothetical protein [Wolbachia endosymbiont of Laodelphax striatellus]|nr:hypothetical protein [Wolbachia endosymbiont of Laodelphax striatellus]
MVIKVLNNGSCVNREVHAQFCEGLVGKFHWSTRLAIQPFLTTKT